jgi:hypothetical protein
LDLYDFSPCEYVGGRLDGTLATRREQRNAEEASLIVVLVHQYDAATKRRQ